MKNIVVLFAGGDMSHAFAPICNEKSAFDCALSWAQHAHSRDIVVLASSKNVPNLTAACLSVPVDMVVRDSWTNGDIAAEIASACERHTADSAVYAWADCPFLNTALTEELLRLQSDYKAEYSFADGFAYGFAPEVINKGTAAILASLAKDSQKRAGEKTASRDALFSIMAGDINSFEIETVIAEKDYRLLRLSFDCGSKATALSCTRLFEAAKASALIPAGQEMSALDVYALSDLAEKDTRVLQTVPAFYNVQISARYNHQDVYTPYEALQNARNQKGLPPLTDMPLESFKALVSDIAATSEKAVVSLSLFGEPLLHPQFADFVAEVLRYPSLSVFVETDGTLVTESLASEIAALDGGKGAGRVSWCVLLDAMSIPLYAVMHSLSDAAQATQAFSAANASVAILAKHFPHQTYPQFVRTKTNEAELESFYRYWKKSDSPSLGELVIQKYDSFCGCLPDAKSADLSPLNRFPCWHLRRDLCVLSDGTVPLCRSAVLCAPENALGNVFQENIETVWTRLKDALESHVAQSYSEKCKACDEYYTFNF